MGCRPDFPVAHANPLLFVSKVQICFSTNSIWMSCFCFNDWHFISWCVGVSCMFFMYNGGVGFLRFLKLFVCARVLGLSVDLDLVSYCFRRSSRGKTFFILNCGGWIYATSGKTVTSRKSLNLHFFFNDSVQLYFALYH